jgi:hypothetical protein
LALPSFLAQHLTEYLNEGQLDVQLKAFCIKSDLPPAQQCFAMTCLEELDSFCMEALFKRDSLENNGMDHSEVGWLFKELLELHLHCPPDYLSIQEVEPILSCLFQTFDHPEFLCISKLIHYLTLNMGHGLFRPLSTKLIELWTQQPLKPLETLSLDYLQSQSNVLTKSEWLMLLLMLQQYQPMQQKAWIRLFSAEEHGHSM